MVNKNKQQTRVQSRANNSHFVPLDDLKYLSNSKMELTPWECIFAHTSAILVENLIVPKQKTGI